MKDAIYTSIDYCIENLNEVKGKIDVMLKSTIDVDSIANEARIEDYAKEQTSESKVIDVVAVWGGATIGVGLALYGAFANRHGENGLVPMIAGTTVLCSSIIYGAATDSFRIIRENKTNNLVERRVDYSIIEDRILNKLNEINSESSKMWDAVVEENHSTLKSVLRKSELSDDDRNVLIVKCAKESSFNMSQTDLLTLLSKAASEENINSFKNVISVYLNSLGDKVNDAFIAQKDVYEDMKKILG